MIRVLSHGYNKEDFKFLNNILRDSIRDVHGKCGETNERCIYCPNRRACIDVTEVIEFLEKRCDK